MFIRVRDMLINLDNIVFISKSNEIDVPGVHFHSLYNDSDEMLFIRCNSHEQALELFNFCRSMTESFTWHEKEEL